MNNCISKTIKATSYLKGRIGWQGLRASEFVDDGPFLITGTDFIDGKIDWNTCYHVSEARYKEAAYIHVKNGDILITKDGTIGKVAYAINVPEKAVLNSGIFLLRSKNGNYLHRYVYHILRSFKFDDFLRKNLNGSTINHLYQYVFEKFEIPLPRVEVQEKFVKIINSIDSTIEHTKSLIHKYQQIKSGLMHDLFTRGVTADGKLRPPREQAPELYKETSIGWIPKEWKCEELVNLLAPVANNIRSGPFGSALLKAELVEDGVPLLGIDNIHVEQFVPFFGYQLKPEQNQPRPKKLSPKVSFLIA